MAYNHQTTSFSFENLPAVAPQHQVDGISEPSYSYNCGDHAFSAPGIDHELFDFHTELASTVNMTKATLEIDDKTTVDEKKLQYAMMIANVIARIRIPGVVSHVQVSGDGVLTLMWTTVGGAWL